MSMIIFIYFAAALMSTALTGQNPSKAQRMLKAMSTSNNFIRTQIVNYHNVFRSSVDPPASNMLAMKWSNEAATNADKWAAYCSQNHSHPENRTTKYHSCGENLFMSTSGVSWKYVVNQWYGENKNVIYGKKSTGKTGHYTQVVWLNSHQVGCAVHYCPNHQYPFYYVCHYCPI
ncbi:cysteine-rich secretory protein 2-like isoform X2 [Protopterus annectens]|uniref:cysteine-rich secretory protein 2-like isoform X2 n=1 Tax=Protopterus annectens TaxID=7888 RepID=UPI001CF9D462|nr:cysteine-rich secretory protein 2-like isoform X2 [Protopterus annectens]